MKTRKAFYRTLKNISHKFSWKMEQQGCIVGQHKGNGEMVCALTAVINDRNGWKKVYSIADFDHAGKDLGLEKSDTFLIAHSFDNSKSYETNSQVRKALLRAVGLEEMA